MSICLIVRPTVTYKAPSVLKLQSSNLAIKFLILISRKLPTRFLKFCLEAEIFDVKDARMPICVYYDVDIGDCQAKLFFRWFVFLKV